MKRLSRYLLLLLICSSIESLRAEEPLTVSSPDGHIIISVKLDNGRASYSVTKNKKVVIAQSALGFKLKNTISLDQGFKLIKQEKRTFNETWEQPWGEKRFIANNYNELSVQLQENKRMKRKLTIIFRAFDDGFGFRYLFSEQQNLTDFVIADEETEFNLPAVCNAWWIPVHSDNSYYESIPRHTAINKVDTINTPVTLETKDGLLLAIHEANLTDYASMTLVRRDSSKLKCDLVPWANGDKVYAKAPFVTPWRTVIIGEKPGDLVTSYLMLNLNEPCKLTDISWVKPSKYIGIWWGMHLEKYSWAQGAKHGATTKNTMKYIDFASQNGFSGVLVEGWNEGWDGNWSKDGNAFSFTKAYPDFDLEKICQYAASKNVKLIGHNETGGAVANYEKQMEDGFKQYEKLGVNAVKTGYVNKYLDGKEWHDGQFAVRHYRKVFEMAAKHHIMIDNHEPVKPTGLCRTYPNFMTQEGARGQEYDAWSDDGGNPPFYTTVIPFTRMLAGPFDFTPGTFNFKNPVKPKTRVQTTIAKQLALFVVLYSPLQMASDLPENYENNPAFEFIRDVPCDWDETLVPDARIGEYVVMVRKDRNSANWYLGAITNEKPRELTVDLSFLPKGKKFRAQIYTDGENADWKTAPNDYLIKEISTDAADKLQLKLAAGGGTAIRFCPVD